MVLRQICYVSQKERIICEVWTNSCSDMFNQNSRPYRLPYLRNVGCFNSKKRVLGIYLSPNGAFLFRHTGFLLSFPIHIIFISATMWRDPIDVPLCTHFVNLMKSSGYPYLFHSSILWIGMSYSAANAAGFLLRLIRLLGRRTQKNPSFR